MKHNKRELVSALLGPHQHAVFRMLSPSRLPRKGRFTHVHPHNMAILCSFFAIPNLCTESSEHRPDISERICFDLGEHCYKNVIAKRINGATHSQYELFFIVSERYSDDDFGTRA